MSILSTGTLYDMGDKIDIDTNETHALGGVLIRAQLAFDDHLVHMADDVWREHVRSELARALSHTILRNKMVEITTTHDPTTLRRQVMARCYLLPDGQVRLLRTKG